MSKKIFQKKQEKINNLKKTKRKINKNLIDDFDIKIYKQELSKYMDEIIKLKELEENLEMENKDIKNKLAIYEGENNSLKQKINKLSHENENSKELLEHIDDLISKLNIRKIK